VSPFILVPLSYRCIHFKVQLKWVDGRYLFILSNTATSSPALTTRLDLLGDLFCSAFPTLAVASCGMKSHLSPYSNDADVRNDMQKTIWYGSKATESQAPKQNKCFAKQPPHDYGASKFGDRAFSGARSPRFVLHVHGSYAYEWPTRFLHYRHFFAIPSARQSRFDLQQAQKMAHALVLGVSRNTNNRPAYQHEPRAPIGFRLTSPVWRLCT